MSKTPVTALKSISFALVIGSALAYGLYMASNSFFSAKNKQTLIKATELGQTSSGDVVFPIGASLPNVRFEILNSSGGNYDLEKDRSTLKIVNFWASWCEPCVEEFSSFARLLKEFNGEISFVGVSEDKTEQDAKDFLKAFSGDFKNLEKVYFGYDQNKKHSILYGLLALPESFIVDQDNKLVRRVSGFEKWDSKEAVGYFKKLIEDQKNKRGETL